MALDSTIILDDKGPRQGYGWAFSVSTWVHLALLVALVWLPVVRPHEEEKKVVVEFDVAKKETQRPKPREPEPQTLRRRTAPSPPPPDGAPAERRVPVPPAGDPQVQPQVRMRETAPSAPRETTPTLPRSSSEGPKGDRPAGPAGGTGEPAQGPGQGPGVPGRSQLSRALSDFRHSLLGLEGSGGGGKGNGGEGSGGSGIGMGPPSASGFGFGNLLFEGNDFDFVKSGYASQAYYAILKAWYRRLFAMADQFEKWAFARETWMLDHQNQIRFVIGRSGQIVRVDLINESGCQPLDTSAMDALREVILPPLPPDFARGEEGVVVTFIASGDIHAMRTDPQLRYAYYGY
jgi:hypothetical protein